MKTVYITVKLTLDDNANIDEVIGEMDSTFSYENAIIDSEIMDVQEK